MTGELVSSEARKKGTNSGRGSAANSVSPCAATLGRERRTAAKPDPNDFNGSRHKIPEFSNTNCISAFPYRSLRNENQNDKCMSL